MFLSPQQKGTSLILLRHQLKFATEAQRTQRYFYIGFLHENAALNHEILYYFSLCVSVAKSLNVTEFFNN